MTDPQTTLADAWARYSATIPPEFAPLATPLRHAFYTGATAVMSCVLALGDAPEEDDGKSYGVLAGLDAEVCKFVAECTEARR